MRAVREGLAQAVAGEIVDLLAGAGRRCARSDIFVLTRTWVEAKAVAGALGARGVPAVIYNQEGLYASPEARQVRDLLRAVADPRDPAKRLRAWLTPFFGLSLADLPAAAGAEGDHPLFAPALRLARGRGARAARAPLRAASSTRAASFRASSSSVRARAGWSTSVTCSRSSRPRPRARARPLGDVVRRLSALCEKLLVPEAEEGNVQRLESDHDAVQIMTMHKAKGLEAEVVFLYGGYSPSPNRGVRHYTDAGSRVAMAGRPRTNALADLIKRERESEDQRLFYVALTRARRRLYLPFSGEAPEADAPSDGGGVREDRWKLTGGYTHVNRRLRALRADETQRRHFETRDVPIDPRGSGDGGRPRLALGLVGWRPDVEKAAASTKPATKSPTSCRRSRRRRASAPASPEAELAQLRRHRVGPTLTSYSRIKQSEGGYRPPTEIHDETNDAPPLADDDLPGRRARRGLRPRSAGARAAGDAAGDRRLRGLGRARRHPRAAGGDAAPARARSAAPRWPPRAWPTRRSPPRSPSSVAFSPAWPTRSARRARWSSCSPSPRRPAAPTAATSRGSSICCSSTRGASTSATGRPIASRAGTRRSSRPTSPRTTRCRSSSTRWRWSACSASPAKPTTRRASAGRSTSSCAACRARSAAAARPSPSSRAWGVEIAGRLGAEESP